MKLLVITDPQEVANEAETIAQLFKEGLEILHYRKPDWSYDKYEALLREIAPEHYKKIVIHAHFKLIEKYNLKGLHLKSRFLSGEEEATIKGAFGLAKRRRITISSSMHSFQEIMENKWKFDYVFLSPLFDSISKEGYHSDFNPEEIKKFMQEYNSPMKIIALGGINEMNIAKVKEYGFAGAALLGAIWKEKESVDRLKKIKSLLIV